MDYIKDILADFITKLAAFLDELFVNLGLVEKDA